MTSRKNLDSVWVYAMVCQKFIQAICKKKKQTKAKCTTVRESRRKYIHLSIFLENNDERQRVCKALILDNLNIRGKVSYTLIEQKWLSAVREQKGKKNL